MTTTYLHSQTFCDYDRWAAHDCIGALLARGITSVAIALVGSEYTVAWREHSRPAVIPLPFEEWPPGVVA